MAEVFISYSRVNIEFAKKLVGALDSADRSSWKDWGDIPISEDWWERIKTGIDGADTFVFIISPASLTSSICTLEVAHAIEYGKRILPVLYQDFDGSDVLGKIASKDEKPLADKLLGRDLLEVARANLQVLNGINWLYFRDTDPFEDSFRKLLKTVDTDLKHAKAHTRLLVRAREWEDNRRDTSFLLTGNDLREATNWLEFNRDKFPYPQSIHERFIAASIDQRERLAEDVRRRRRNIQRATLLALAVVTALALLSFGLYRVSEENLQLADNRGTAVAYQASTAQSNADMALTEAARADHNAATSDANYALAVTNEANANRQAELSQSLALAAFSERAAANDDMDLAVALAVQSVVIPNPPEEAQRVLNDVVFMPGTRLRIQEPYDDDTNSSNAAMFRVAFSPDDRFVLSGAAADVRLWDIKSGTQLFDLGSHARDATQSGVPIVTGAEFSQDGKQAITVGDDDIRIWDVETGKELHVIELGFDPATASFTKDWSQVLLGDTGGDVEFRDLASNKVLWHVENVGSGQIWNSDISPDGTLGVTGDFGNSVILWDLHSGEIIQRLEGTQSSFRTPEQVVQINFSPDGKKLLATSSEGYFLIFDLATGELLEELDLLSVVKTASLDSDQKLLAVAYFDNTMRVWDLTNKTVVERYAGHTGTIWDIAFNSDASMLASASGDATIRVWDLARQSTIQEYRGHVAQITNLSISPDGNRFVSTAFDGSAKLWDMSTARILQPIKLFDASNLLKANFSHDGKLFAVNSTGALSLFDATTGREVFSPRGLTNTVVTSFFSPDSTMLFIAGTDHAKDGYGAHHAYVQEWDIENGREIYRFTHLGIETAALSAALSADGRLLITPFFHENVPAYMMGAITIWDLQANNQYRNLPQITERDFVISMSVSPDNQRIAYSTPENIVRVRELTSGDIIAEFSAHQGFIHNVLFTDEGENLLTASLDGTVRLWNIATGQELRRIRIDSGAGVHGLAISPDLTSILVGDNEGIIRRYFWSPTIEGILAWAHANRYIRDFTCVERITYNILPLCQDGTPIPNMMTSTTAAPSFPAEELTAANSSDMPASTTTATTAVTQACLPVIAEGETQGQANMWAFHGEAGDILSVRMESEQIDPYLIIKNSAREIIAVNDDYLQGVNTAFIQDQILNEAGDYFIIADRYGIGTNDEGRFSLSVQLLHANGQCLDMLEPTPVVLLGVAFDRGSINDPIRITTLGQGSNAHRAGLQQYDDILAIDGQSVVGLTDRAVRDLIRMPINSQIVFTAIRSGQPVDFILDLSDSPQAEYTEPVISRIHLNERMFGWLSPGEQQVWVFEGRQGQELSLHLEGNGRKNNTYLFSPSGYLVKQAVEFGKFVDTLWESTSIIPRVVLTEDGTYVVRVTSDGTKGYEGYFLVLNELSDNGTLVQQSSDTDHLSPLIGQTWQFEAVRGQVLNLQLLQRDSLIDAYMMLLDPAGNIVACNLDYGFTYLDSSEYDPTSHLRLEIRDFVMPATGNYTLIVNPHIHFNPVPENLWGSYTLESSLNSVEPIKRLQSGESARGNLAVGDTDFWLLELEEGQTVNIAVDADKPVIFANTPDMSREQAIKDGYFDTYIELYDPQSQLVGEDDDGIGKTSNALIDGFKAEASGTYVIAVRSALMRLTGGEYTITVTEAELFGHKTR